MARKNTEHEVDLEESSIYGKDMNDNPASNTGDTATEETLDRLESITGGADEPGLYEGRLAREVDKLEASTEEEVDALRVDLVQGGDLPNARHGSGRIVDDLAAEHMAGATETGPQLADKGVVSAVPGRDDTGAVLRRHHPSSSIARSEDVIEGNLDEPRDEEREERKADESTAA